MINTALDSLYTYIYLSTSVCLFSTTNLRSTKYLQNISLNKSFIHRTSQEFYYNNQITIFNFFALDSSKISKFHDSIPLNRSIDNPRKGSNETSGGRLKKPEFHEQMIASLYRPWDRLYRAKYYIATCCIKEKNRAEISCLGGTHRSLYPYSQERKKRTIWQEGGMTFADRYRKYSFEDRYRRPIILARGVFNLRSLRNAIENDTSRKNDL